MAQGRTGSEHTLQVKQTVLSALKTSSTMVGGARGAPAIVEAFCYRHNYGWGPVGIWWRLIDSYSGGEWPQTARS